MAPSFDDVRSYSLRIDAGKIAMTPESLSTLLNTQVFAYKRAPLGHIESPIDGTHLKQRGTLHKGVAIPFSMVADVAATADGRIRVRPITLKTAGIPARGLLKMLHVGLDDLVKSNPARGFETSGDDLLLDPARLLPDPRISGRLTAIRIEGGRLVEVFGASPAAGPRGEAKNYMHYRGNALRFGRLTMTDTDMRLIDADPRDPFEFSPLRLSEAVGAGLLEEQRRWQCARVHAGSRRRGPSSRPRRALTAPPTGGGRGQGAHQ